MEEHSQLAGLGNVLSELSKNPALISTIARLVNNSGAQQPSSQSQNSETDPTNTAGLETIIKLMSSPDGAASKADRDQCTQNTEAPKAERPKNTPDIESILRALSIAQGTSSPNGKTHNSSNDFFDPIRHTLGGKEESENRIRLLNALRPYLCEERRNKLDVLIRLLRIVELGELKGLLGIR